MSVFVARSNVTRLVNVIALGLQWCLGEKELRSNVIFIYTQYVVYGMLLSFDPVGSEDFILKHPGDKSSSR